MQIKWNEDPFAGHRQRYAIWTEQNDERQNEKDQNNGFIKCNTEQFHNIDGLRCV